MTILREERIGGQRLILGDCREVMPGLGRFDAAFTSPPYNMREENRAHFSAMWPGAALKNGYATHSDDMPYPEYREWQQNVLREMWSHMAEDGVIFYNHKPRQKDKVLWTPLELNPGLPVRQIIIWDRGARINFLETAFVSQHEWVVVFAKDRFRLRSRSASAIGDVWNIPPAVNETHPAPFPVQLPLKALSATKAKTVLEPFMGSGTTLVACQRLGRQGTGIEIDPGYFETACERVHKAWREPDLFIKDAPPPPVQESLL